MAPLLVGWLSLLLGVSQTFTIAGRSAKVTAEHIVHDQANCRVYLVGDARLIVDDLEFAADQVVIDFADARAPAVLADGQVTVLQPGRGRMEAARAHYDLSAETSEFEALRIDVPLNWRAPLSSLARPDEVPESFHLEAEHASQQGDRVRLERSWLSTSRATPPQYSLRSERLDVTFGQGRLSSDVARISARGVRLQLYGSTVLGLPSLDIGEQAILLPKVGTNRTDGLFVQHEFSFGLMRNTRLTLAPKLGSESLLTGRARFATGGPWGVLEAIAAFRERQVLEVAKEDYQISRLPELGYVVPPFEVPGLGGWISPYFSYGYFDEEDRLTAWRWQALATYDTDLHRGGTSSAAMQLGARSTGYGNGDWYGLLWAGLTVEKQLPYWLYNRVRVTSHLISGATPFRFDRIEIPTAVEHDLRLRLSDHWLASNSIKLDVNEKVLRRWELGLAYRDGELEYGARVLARPGFELALDARLVGL